MRMTSLNLLDYKLIDAKRENGARAHTLSAQRRISAISKLPVPRASTLSIVTLLRLTMKNEKIKIMLALHFMAHKKCLERPLTF